MDQWIFASMHELIRFVREDCSGDVVMTILMQLCDTPVPCVPLCYGGDGGIQALHSGTSIGVQDSSYVSHPQKYQLDLSHIDLKAA